MLVEQVSGNLVRIQTDDGLHLEGLAVPPRFGHNWVIHVHGLSGSFYENRFLYRLGERLAADGWGFLTVNTRGHDYIADIMTATGETRCIGGNHELLSESGRDLDAWLTYVKNQLAAETIVLEGHSYGCIKVGQYLVVGRAAGAVKRAILISPPDVWGLERTHCGDPAKFLEQANALLTAGQGSEMLPSEAFVYPIDAAGFADLFGEAQRPFSTMFSFANESELRSSRIGDICAEIAVIIGGEDSAVVSPRSECIERITSALGGVVYTKVIPGAPHNYWGHEDELAAAVLEALSARAPVTPRVRS